MEFKNLYEVLQEFSTLLADLYKDALLSSGAVSSYKLFNSVATVVRQQGQFFEVSIRLEDYWQVIEYGRRPNSQFPPIEQIRSWIKVKPIIPREDDSGKIPTENSLVYLIGRKIARDGIPARPLLQESIDEALSLFYEKINEALEKDADEIVQIEIFDYLKKQKYQTITIN